MKSQRLSAATTATRSPSWNWVHGGSHAHDDARAFGSQWRCAGVLAEDIEYVAGIQAAGADRDLDLSGLWRTPWSVHELESVERAPCADLEDVGGVGGRGGNSGLCSDDATNKTHAVAQGDLALLITDHRAQFVGEGVDGRHIRSVWIEVDKPALPVRVLKGECPHESP